MRMRRLLNFLFSALILFSFSISACQSGPSRAETYAREHNILEQNIVTLSQLELDPNAQSLIDQLSLLPPGVQSNEKTLNYLKEITADRKISENELSRMNIARKISKLSEGQVEPGQYVSYKAGILYVLSNKNPNLVRAYEYLQTVSDKALSRMASFGIDDNVTDYIQFVSTLTDRDIAVYALENRLCIEDRNLTEQEKKFLQSHKQNITEMLDYYLSGIQAIDQELADKIKQLPYMKEKAPALKNVEALEDILSLASDTTNRSNLETLYGKGTERNIWPVALERIFYKAFDNEFDENSPFEGTEWYVNSKLAEFQQKYNKEMDEANPVEDKKPQVLGINYIWEMIGSLKKSDDDINLDYALMRWVLGANAVKIWGLSPVRSDIAFNNVKLAHEEGLVVWLEYCPVYILETRNPDISVESYCGQLAGFAQQAERLGVEVLVVGHEVDVHLKRFDYKTNALREAVDEMVKVARQNYSGLITYCTWDGPWDVCNINWEPMDIIHPQIYKSDTTRELTDSEYINIINKWKNKMPRKPLANSEFGSLTISEGASIGGWNDLLKTTPYHYDTQAQADFVERQLKVLFKADIYGIFLQCWDEGVNPAAGYDQSEVGYGIWDWRDDEPKPSFWVVYKYYRER